MVRKTRRRLLPFMLAILLALSTLTGCAKRTAQTENNESAQEESKPNSSLGITIGYSDDLVPVEDPNELQRLVDEAYAAAAQEGIGLEYKGEAVSDNGIDFDCYIANSSLNSYDMFIALYGDAELTDELYLSQLMRPGSAFNHLTLNHALPVGSNTVYVAFTQVVLEDGEQKIRAQTMVTIDFIVEES